MSYTTVSVDIDVEEVLWNMSSKEKQDLVDDLYEAGYIPEELEEKERSYNDDFSLACEKLKGQSWRLSREEEEFIINLSKRF
jgi:hypothetical protein